MADLALNIRIKAIDEAGRSIRDLVGDLRSMNAMSRDLTRQGRNGQGVSAVGRGAKRASGDLRAAAQGMADLGRGAEGLIRGPIQAAEQYETSLANIRTLTDEATFSTEELRDITRNASKEFGGSAADQAGALYDIISAGASNAAEATGTLDAANRLAIGGLTDVTTATKALNATVANFTGEEVTAADAADALFVAVRKGRTTVGETAKAFPKVANAAGAMGLELKEASAIYATLTLTAKNSADASTQAAALLSATTKPTKQATDALKALNSQRSEENQLRIDSAALKDLGATKFAEQFENLNETDLAKLFGGERARKGVQGLIANLDKLEETRKAEADRAGAAEQAAKVIGKTRAQRLKLLEARMDDARLAIGEAVIPVADALTPALVEVATVVGEIAESHPEIIKVGGALAIAAVGFGKVGQGLVGFSRTMESFAAITRVARGAVNKLEPAMQSAIGGSKAGMLGAGIAALSLGVAIGTFLDEQFALSDKIARRLSGVDDEQRVEQRGLQGLPGTTKAIVKDSQGNIVTDVNERRALAMQRSFALSQEGKNEGEISAALTQQGFLSDEFSVQAQQRRRKNVQAGRPELNVKIEVDSEGVARVKGVQQSNYEGDVKTDTGEGLAFN